MCDFVDFCNIKMQKLQNKKNYNQHAVMYGSSVSAQNSVELILKTCSIIN